MQPNLHLLSTTIEMLWHLYKAQAIHLVGIFSFFYRLRVSNNHELSMYQYHSAEMRAKSIHFRSTEWTVDLAKVFFDAYILALNTGLCRAMRGPSSSY